MASRRSLVVDAVYNAVNASTATNALLGATYTKPVGVTVHRSKTVPIEADALPAMVVYRVAEEILSRDGPRGHKVKRGLRVRIECRVGTTADGETLEDALDPQTSWAVQAVMADPTLGGVTDYVQEVSTDWAVADANKVYGAAAVDFLIPYITAAGNPDA
jgi:hypothetical protein